MSTGLGGLLQGIIMQWIKWIIGAIVLLSIGTAWGQSERYYTLRPEPAVSNMVLAIDCSGSMAGQAFEDAKAGAVHFVEGMHASDRAAVVAFSDAVEEVVGWTGDRVALRQAIRGLRAGGATRLYDAIARSVLKLIHQEGARIVVFLTDGQDTGSRYTVEELRKITTSEGLFVYGIGLGDVDRDALSALSAATGGTFLVASRSSDIRDLYPHILGEYYQKYGDLLNRSGGLSVRSLPDGRTVLVNGQEAGKSPLKLDVLTPGTYRVQVLFDGGTWEQEIPVKEGQRTLVDARASHLGGTLVMASLPPNANVFLDGTYVGTTAIAQLPIRAGEAGWVQAAIRDSRQLRVSRIPYGSHQLRFRALPDVDFGSQQEFQVEIQVSELKAALYVEVFGTGRSPYALYSAGKAQIMGAEGKGVFDFDDFE